MTPERADFERGAYAAFNEVLLYLNTLNEQHSNKAVSYKHIVDMRPTIVDFAFSLTTSST